MAEKPTKYKEPTAEGIAYLEARGFELREWDKKLSPAQRPIPRLELTRGAFYKNVPSGGVLGTSGATPWNPTNGETEALVNALAYMISETRDDGNLTRHTEPGEPIPIFIKQDTYPSWRDAIEALIERFPPTSQ